MKIERMFTSPEPVELDVKNSSGSVTVTASDTEDIRVTIRSDSRDVDQCDIDFSGRRLVIRVPERRLIRLHGFDIEVTVPDGSSVKARTASADVRVNGRIDSLDVETASGNATAEEVDGEAKIGTASGDIQVSLVTGDIRGRSASGDIIIGCAETVSLHTASGDVTISELGASGEAKTASGDIEVTRAAQGDLRLNSVSGDIQVGVASGTAAHLSLHSLSGRMNSEMPIGDSAPETGATLDVTARTVSGDITIMRAPAAQPRAASRRAE